MFRTGGFALALIFLAATFTASVHGLRKRPMDICRLFGCGGPGGGSGGTTNSIYHVYHPPQQIHYTPIYVKVPAHPYPIYRQTPPNYVNNYMDSGSKFSTLLTGLALYNLGRSTLPQHSHHDHAGQVGEKCSLGFYMNLVKIPCEIVSTFDGTTHSQDWADWMTAWTTPKTPVDPLELKGEPVRLWRGHLCFVERRSRMRHSVDEIESGLLQQYALQSMQQRHVGDRNPNSASHHKLSFVTLFIATISAYALY